MNKKTIIFGLLALALATFPGCQTDSTTFAAGEYPDMRPEPEPGEEPEEDLSTKDIVTIDPLTNPGTGYHLEIKYIADKDNIFNFQNPFTTPPLNYPAGFINDGIRDNNASRDAIHVSQLYLYLSKFRTSSSLPTTVIAKMQEMMDIFHDNGYKVILRFAYNYDDTTAGGDVSTATYLKNHLKALDPFIKANMKTIACIQAGTIGKWGEWHTSSIGTNQTNRNTVVNSLLGSLPEPYCLEVRMPEFKRKLTLDKPEYAARIGIHNDYFTAGQHPMASGSDIVPGTADYNEAAGYAPYCFMSGEMPYDEGGEWGLGFTLDSKTTLTVLRDQHYSAFNLTHNNNRNFPAWQFVKVYPKLLDEWKILYSEDYFKEADGELVPRSMYEFIRDHLGYRLNYLPTSEVKAEGGELVYDIKFTNTGFATVVNPAQVFLVLIGEDGTVAKELPVSVNPKDWQPYQPGDGTFTVLEHNIKGTATAGVSGKYRVGIWMPDGLSTLANNKYDNRFDIKWGVNAQLSHWNSEDGRYTVNVIGEVTF